MLYSTSVADPNRFSPICDGENEVFPDELTALRRGDNIAFTRFVRHHQNSLTGFLVTMLGCREEAKDAAQDVFEIVFKKIGQFRGEAELKTWLFCIARNVAINRLRARTRRMRHEATRDFNDAHTVVLEPVAQGSYHPDIYLFRRRLAAFVDEVVSALPASQRLLLLRHVFEGISYESLASEQGISVGTVKSRLGRIRRSLRTRLHAWLNDDDLRCEHVEALTSAE